MNLRERTLSLIKKRRQKVLSGEVNAIPHSFERFSQYYLGPEQGIYTLITASTKAGKSSIMSFLYLFLPIMYSFNTGKPIKIFYVALEESPERVLSRFISYLLYTLHNKEVSFRYLMSSSKYPLSQEILNLIEGQEIQQYLEHFDKCVEFIEDDHNPTGIYKIVKKYCEDNGTVKTVKYKKAGDFGTEEEREKFQYYTPNNPDEWVFLIVDHLGLVENERGFSLKQSIDKLSEYCIILRNRYKVSPVMVQQQLDNETADNFRTNLVRPTLTGLRDSKNTGKDAEITLGLHSPFRAKETNFMGYDVTLLKSKLVALEILADRNGETGAVIPLLFNGACCHYEEAPRIGTPELENIYQKIRENKNIFEKVKDAFFSFLTLIKQTVNG